MQEEALDYSVKKIPVSSTEKDQGPQMGISSPFITPWNNGITANPFVLLTSQETITAPSMGTSLPFLSTSHLLPTTSLALTAVQRRRRRSSDGSGKKLRSVPEERKDDAYWERRRKNNEAAKRSRDTRKAKEEEIAFRAAYLEQENLKLKAQLTMLKNELAKLHTAMTNQAQ